MVTGKTQQEFKNSFIPHFYPNGKEYDCLYNNTPLYRYLDGDGFDLKLQSYVLENPDSYSGLWMLIERFSSSGYSSLYEEILNSFSQEMKQEELWKIFYNDIRGIRIIKNQKFPSLELKTEQLEIQKLDLSTEKFVLVDFWFSSCRPCLKTFPAMKKLYEKYESYGFEIIGISVDRTNRIDAWKEVIEEKELDWVHFLDENGIQAKRENIISFPTNFLLNKKGMVIRKNISMEELEKFLEENCRT